MTAKVLNIPRAYYDAGRVSDQHHTPRASGTADMVVSQGLKRMRDWARHLDENHDIVTGALDKTANFVIGEGLEVEPMVRDRRGNLLERVNEKIRAVLLDDQNPQSWARHCEVSGQYNLAQLSWMVLRSTLRDGEILSRGQIRRNPSEIGYQCEIVEPDFLPLEYHRPSSGELNAIVCGVEKDQFRRPVAYHFLRNLPADLWVFNYGFSAEQVVSVPGEQITHFKIDQRRFGQTRGVPIFHSAIHRLDGVADFEKSHIAAARAAARVIGQLTRSSTALTAPSETTDTDENNFGLLDTEMGQVFTEMAPGDEWKWYKPEHPNQEAVPFLDDQGRRLAAGFGLGWSTFWQKYDKSFSAARQEQSENWPHILFLRSKFISQFFRPALYEPALRAALQSGAIRMPQKADPNTYFAADIRGPARPTIDDQKQAAADTEMIENRTDSRLGRIRERGRNARQIDAENERDTRDTQTTRTQIDDD